MKLIARYLTPRTRIIKGIRERLTELEQFNHVLHRSLDEAWKAHCRFVRYDEEKQTLVLSTDAQSLLTPLRFMHASLLKQCQRQSSLFKTIRTIECIYTPLYQPREKIRAPLPLSEKAATSCLEAADHCPPALKNALKKLATMIRKTPN